jgi:AraC-like DNA-binding protein
MGVLAIQLECGFESASYFVPVWDLMSSTKHRQQNRAAVNPE